MNFRRLPLHQHFLIFYSASQNTVTFLECRGTARRAPTRSGLSLYYARFSSSSPGRCLRQKERFSSLLRTFGNRLKTRSPQHGWAMLQATDSKCGIGHEANGRVVEPFRAHQ